jgi:D-3-phosphoglycerate dehydrogenase
MKEAVGDKLGKRLVITKKKMGAQTGEANDNCGVAAANQIVGFFEKGVTKFALKA